jgi:hypothetical protein
MEPTLSLPQPPSLHADEPPEPAPPSMLYVYEHTVWEYKLLVRTLDQEGLPSEVELNTLGAQGWELAGIATQRQAVHCYFKRPRT